MFDAVAVTLPAADMERAKAFYRDYLDLEPYQTDEDGTARYNVGDMMMLLYPSEFAGTNQATAAGFGVSDLEGTVAGLRVRGIAFEEYDFGDAATVDGILSFPDGTKAAWFKDTEGNILGLFQDAGA